MVEDVETDEYPSFTFEVVPDNLVPVIYDVYLLDLPSKSGNIIHIDRTEIGEDDMAFYEGEDDLRFLLMSFSVPPNATDLDNVSINVKSVVRNDASNNTEQ
jgi:hypothetical protein